MERKYERKVSADGLAIYYRDGKRVAKRKVPEEWIKRLDPNSPLEVSDMEDSRHPATEIVDQAVEIKNNEIVKEIPFRVCVFCGKEGSYIRYAEGKNIYVCEDHYYHLTLGKLVQHLRKEQYI